jgi:arabinofuranosyltransferase
MKDTIEEEVPGAARPRLLRFQNPLWPILAIVVPTALLLTMAVLHRWITDDAFIDVRVIGNIVAGHGPVFNVGERVEVYTDPLWVLILTLVRLALPFAPIEGVMVVLGITFTTVGVILGSAATVRFARPASKGLVLPVGAVVVAAVDAMWWFASSGLETGLAFGWIGLCWWLVVRRASPHAISRGGATAFVLGLGPLIRPEAGILALSFFSALALTERHWSRLSRGRFAVLAGSFLAAPVISEAFRVAYFGLLVPNTALAKSAFSVELAQGWQYLYDFVHSSDLWLPAFILGVVTLARLGRWAAGDHRYEAAVLGVVALGALVYGFYVVWIGGDFMHARMLLPAFFLLALVSWLDLGEPLERRLPLVFLTVWAAGSALFLRYPPTVDNQYGITNERQAYLDLSQEAHPVMLGDYTRSWNFQHGRFDRRLALRVHRGPGRKKLVSACHCGMEGPGGWSVTRYLARSALPEDVFANASSIGIWSTEAGSNVYIFDNFGLANPVGSHFYLTGHRTPGVADLTDNTWMLARFAAPGVRFAGVVGTTVRAERRALSCQPLSGYLRTIDGPFGWSVVWSDVTHALTWTTMKFSSDPVVAERQLCDH